MTSRIARVVLCAGFWTSPAFAQEAEKPRVVHHEPAEYPSDAKASGLEAEVELELEIDREGTVTSARVITPVGHGFDEAAESAARKLRFEPARKNGKPVRARIRYRYTFALEKAVPKPEAAPKAGGLRGKLRIAGSGAAIAGAEIIAIGNDGKSHRTDSDSAGSWKLEGLIPGTYLVKVEANGFGARASRHEVKAGTELELAHELSAATSADSGAGVVVQGERPVTEVSRRTLERREIERIPGTRGDALRSIQSMPGVARAPGFSGLLIVRGSAPGDSAVFFDGAPVPLLYHFGGLSSVLPTELVDHIDFHPGNFRARYGRVTGGVIDVGIRSPDAHCNGPYMKPTERSGCYHALAQADLVDVRVLAQGPLGPIRGWTFAAGVRRSWVDTWVRPVQRRAGSGVTAAPVYYDYQFLAETRPARRSSLRARLIGYDDRLNVLDEQGSSRVLTSTEVDVGISYIGGQLLYDAELDDEVKVSAMVSAGRARREVDAPPRFVQATSYPLALRSELGWKPDPRVRVAFGMDFLATPYELSALLPPPNRQGETNPGPFVNRPLERREESGHAYRPAWYLESDLDLTSRLTLVPGVRLDHAFDSGHSDVSPRILARYDLIESDPATPPPERVLRTTLKAGVGLFHQPPDLDETDPRSGTPGLLSARATHYTLGVEQELSKHVDVSVDGFYKDLDRLVSSDPAVGGGYEFGNSATGHVIGMETLLRYKPDARFFGWVAYTLSRSVRRDGPGEPEELFRHDQTHNLTAIGSYRLGRGWEVGARFRLVTGRLARSVGTQNGLPAVYAADAGTYTPLESSSFTERLPTFHQLDLRVEKRWQFRVWRLTAYLDVLNAYNNQGVDAYGYNFDYTERVRRSGLPIVPSFGIRGEF